MSGSSNPSRLKRAFTISLAIAVTAGMAFAMQYAEYQGVFANAEGFALDSFQRVPWQSGPGPEIITIGINTEETTEHFGKTSPLNAASRSARWSQRFRTLDRRQSAST